MALNYEKDCPRRSICSPKYVCRWYSRQREGLPVDILTGPEVPVCFRRATYSRIGAERPAHSSIARWSRVELRVGERLGCGVYTAA